MKKINEKADQERLVRRENRQRRKKTNAVEQMIATGKIKVIKSDEKRENLIEPENEMVTQQSIHAVPTENAATSERVTSEILESTRKVVSIQDAGIQVNHSVQDVEIQVNSDFINPKFLSFIQSDSALSTITGIESFEILNTIEGLRAITTRDARSIVRLCFSQIR